MRSFIFIIVLISICSCLDLKQVINLTESTHDRTINVDNKNEIDFILEGNPTTGYKWYIQEYDKIDFTFLNFIELEIEEIKGYRSTKNYENNENSFKHDTYDMDSLPLLGSAGKYIFKALPQGKNGKITIKFIYLRSWEIDSKENDSIRLNINLVFSSGEESSLNNSSNNSTNTTSEEFLVSSEEVKETNASKISIFSFLILLMVLIIFE